jgi:hypothetical protein
MHYDRVRSSLACHSKDDMHSPRTLNQSSGLRHTLLHKGIVVIIQLNRHEAHKPILKNDTFCRLTVDEEFYGWMPPPP